MRKPIKTPKNKAGLYKLSNPGAAPAPPDREIKEPKKGKKTNYSRD